MLISCVINSPYTRHSVEGEEANSNNQQKHKKSHSSRALGECGINCMHISMFCIEGDVATTITTTAEDEEQRAGGCYHCCYSQAGPRTDKEEEEETPQGAPTSRRPRKPSAAVTFRLIALNNPQIKIPATNTHSEGGYRLFNRQLTAEEPKSLLHCPLPFGGWVAESYDQIFAHAPRPLGSRINVLFFLILLYSPSTSSINRILRYGGGCGGGWNATHFSIL